MRALVTGAAGFIGSTLVDRLLSNGHQVVGIDNLSTGVAGNLESAESANAVSPRSFTFIPLDIQAPELGDIVEGTSPHVIYHLAAQSDSTTSVSNPYLDARSNVLGTINLCEASRRAGVRRIVYAGCRSTEDASRQFCCGADALTAPYSPHAVAKLAAGLYLRAYAAMYDLAPICLSLANVYGPRQRPHGPEASIAVLGSAMITGRPFISDRDNRLAFDYVYVDDAVEAFISAGSAQEDVTGTYAVGTGRLSNVTEVERLIREAVDGLTVPATFAPLHGKPRQCASETCKAAAALGWQPVVDLAEGIARTVHWLYTRLDCEKRCDVLPDDLAGVG